MAIRPRTSFLAATLAIVLGCDNRPASQTPEPKSTPHQPRAFTSEVWKFRADFPAAPKQDKKTLQSPRGEPIQVVQFMVASADKCCVVSVADTMIDPGAGNDEIERRFDLLQEQATRRDGGKITASKKITPDGHPGREFLAAFTEPEPHQIRSQAYLVGNRMYQVTVMGTSSYSTSKEAETFMRSFQLLE